MRLSKEEVKEQFELEEKFYRQMFEHGLLNKRADTYQINLTDKTDYGWKGYLKSEFGLSFNQIQNDRVIDSINENLECIFMINPTKMSGKAPIKIINKKCDPKIPYENPNVKPDEVFIGMNLEWQPIKIDANKHCHFLIAGATGSGKSRGLHMTIASWIMGCKPNEVELYLADLFSDEMAIFKWCKHVKYYANDIPQFYKMLKYLYTKLQKRIKVISPLIEDGICQNMPEYNQQTKNKMTYVYIVIDEFSIIMPSKGDSKEDRQIKEECLDILCKISKLARKMGMFLIIGLQKTVKDEIPTIIKSSSGTRICYRTNDRITSEVLLESHEAYGLEPRYAIYQLNGNTSDMLFTPYIDIKNIKQLIQPHVDKNKSKINLDEFVEAKVELIKRQPYSSYSQKKKIIRSNAPDNPILYNSMDESEDEFIDR